MKGRLANRDVVGFVVALAVAVACVLLGLWQLDRLRQRRLRNAALLAARQRPALTVTQALSTDSTVSRRLYARGVYDYEHERLWRGRSYQGVPGVALVTPLRLPSGAGV